MASVDEIIGQLSVARDHLTDAVQAATHALDLADDACGQAAALGVTSLIERFNLVRDTIAQALEHLALGVAAADHALTLAVRARGDGSPTSKRSSVAEGPKVTLPQWVRDAGASLPDRPGGRGPTHGTLFDATGRQIIDPPLIPDAGLLRSGDVPAARDGLRADWHPRDQVTREHVEAHAAAVLRKPGSPRDAVIVINKPTCVTRGRYVGCDELLPGMLPRGARLTVYVRDERGIRLLKIHDGTGEGMA